MGYTIDEMMLLLPVLFAWDILEGDLYVKAEKFYIHPDIPPSRLSIIEPDSVIPWDVSIDDLPEDPTPFLAPIDPIDATEMENFITEDWVEIIDANETD